MEMLTKNRSLTSLNLGSNLLDAVPIKALNKLTYLTSLFLHENKIQSIKESDFAGKKCFTRFSQLVGVKQLFPNNSYSICLS